MSIRVLSWVFEYSTVEHRGDLLVLLVLADHAQDSGDGAYPSLATIARKARLTRRGAQLALRRLEAQGAISKTGTRPGGMVVYRVATDPPPGAKSLHGGEVTSPGESTSQGGEVSDVRGRSECPGGANSPSPEPSFNHPEPDSPRAQARARRAPPTSSEDKLTDHIQGTLERGIDGLTTDEPAKRPTRQAILTALRKHSPPHDLARAVAIDVRSIAQSQNRAPNIVALFERRLAETTRETREAPQ